MRDESTYIEEGYIMLEKRGSTYIVIEQKSDIS